MVVVVGFFGSRNGCSTAELERAFDFVLGNYDDIEVIVGDCIGVDEQVYNFCKRHGIDVKVIAVRNNWAKISYRPHPDDVLFYVGDPSQPLRARLADRTRALVRYINRHNGVLVGINTSGRGSQLAIRTAQRLGVSYHLF